MSSTFIATAWTSNGVTDNFEVDLCDRNWILITASNGNDCSEEVLRNQTDMKR